MPLDEETYVICIGLSGKPRHGKDSVAAAIERNFPNFKIKRYSVSDLICAELGLKREEVKEVSILQNHSKLRYDQDSLYWIKQVSEAVLRDRPDIAILVNVRRKAEADYLSSSGWKIVRVTALNENGSLYVPMDSGRDLNHELETEMDSYGFQYHLSAIKPGGLRWLCRQAVALAEHLFAEGISTVAP